MKKANIIRMLRLIKEKRAFIAVIVLFSLISAFLTLMIPVYTGEAIDLIIEAGNVNFAAILPLLLKIAIATAITALMQWCIALLSNNIALYASKKLRNKAINKLLTVKIGYIDKNPHGELLSKIINDNERFCEGMIMGLTLFISGIFTIIGTLIFIFSINAYIAIAVVVITPLSLFVARFISKRTFKLFTEQSVTLGELSAQVSETVENFDTVKAFSYEDKAKARFENVNKRLKTAYIKATFFSSTTNPSTRFVNGLVYLAVAMFGAFFSISSLISIGQLSAVLSYAYQYTKPFNEISNVFAELEGAFASFERVNTIIDENAEPDGGFLLEDGSGTVEVNNIAFSYTKERPLIQNLSLSVNSGARVAIVGPTGSGKTTLINLLMRFYDLDSGSILVDGQNIAFVTRESLRAQMGMVLQDTWIKNGTVFDNISYSKPDATEEEIKAAARLAHADAFISRLPQGYKTMISDEMSALSEGERQLICIARVMLKLPPILILDEATSRIDIITEEKIQAAFDTLMQGRTTFVVAHRLVTIKKSDLILVMKDGAVIEQGTHEFLIKQRGFYYALYNAK